MAIILLLQLYGMVRYPLCHLLCHYYPPYSVTQPLIMMPTACWKLDWEELETNSDNFYAFSQLLREKVSYVIITPYQLLYLIR